MLSGVEFYLLNIGVCHSNELLLGGPFQRHFQYFYYSLFTACLLTMSILYALIYRSVLARRSRRHKEKTASLAAEIKKIHETVLESVRLSGTVRGCQRMSRLSKTALNDLEIYLTV